MGQFHNVGRFTTPPEITDIESLAREAYAHLPNELRQVAQLITIEVMEFPTEYMMEALDCETPFEMLGLYQGVDQNDPAVAEALSESGGAAKDVVYLFRRPILDYWCETGEDLAQVVQHVLVHEIGHHFGMSDDDMDRIEFKGSSYC